jgi:hypothetical protein
MGDLVAVNQVVLLQEVLGTLKDLVNAATKHKTHMASCNVRLDTGWGLAVNLGCWATLGAKI